MALTEDKLFSSNENVSITTGHEEPVISSVHSPIVHPAVNLNAVPPSIPPRNYAAINQQNNLYRQQYSPYGMQRPYHGGYSPYPAYSGASIYTNSPYAFNSYMGGYNNPVIGNAESRFIKLAEDSSRPTFQAIESLVRAVQSISFMMESTYGALNMSFRAVLGVVENLSSFRTFLKNLLGSVIALRIIKRFLHIIYVILNSLGLSTASYSQKLQQIESNNNLGSSGDGFSSHVSSWPFLSFMGFMIAAPYLISKILPSPEESNQQLIDRTGVQLMAVYDFNASNMNELSVFRNECVHQLVDGNRNSSGPASPYWVLVVNSKDQIGYVPKNHLIPMPTADKSATIRPVTMSPTNSDQFVAIKQ